MAPGGVAVPRSGLVAWPRLCQLGSDPLFSQKKDASQCVIFCVLIAVPCPCDRPFDSSLAFSPDTVSHGAQSEGKTGEAGDKILMPRMWTCLHTFHWYGKRLFCSCRVAVSAFATLEARDPAYRGRHAMGLIALPGDQQERYNRESKPVATRRSCTRRTRVQRGKGA